MKYQYDIGDVLIDRKGDMWRVYDRLNPGAYLIEQVNGFHGMIISDSVTPHCYKMYSKLETPEELKLANLLYK